LLEFGEFPPKLSEWLHETLPEVKDEHLFQLDAHIRAKVEKYHLSLGKLMGDDSRSNSADATADASADDDDEANVVHEDEVNEANEHVDPDGKTFYTKECCRKCLRCVKL
jgi:hypothetical protein